MKYFLTTVPREATLEQMVFVAKMRWCMERDYQGLKQDFGLDHYDGRGWRGFHHNATLSIAAYGFWMSQRLQSGSSDAAAKSKSIQCQVPSLPQDFLGEARRAQRHVPNSITALRLQLNVALASALGHCAHCRLESASPLTA